MVQDTATTVDDTVATQEQTPSVFEAETEARASAETGQPATTETGKEAAASDWRALLEGRSEDELLEHPTIKGLINRREHGAEQRAQAAAARAEAARKREWAVQGQWRDDLHALVNKGVKVADDGQIQVSLDSKGLDGLSSTLWEVNVAATVGAVGQIIDARIGKDFTITNEERRKLEAAAAAFEHDPVINGGALVELELDLLRRAAIEEATPDIIKKARKDWEKEMADSQKAEQKQAADAQNRNGGTPTQVSGGAQPAVNIQTMDDADAAYAENRISHAEYKKLRERFGVSVTPGA